MCILMGKSLQLFFHSIVLRFKMQNSTVLEKNDFECIFDLFDVQVVTVWSSRLRRTPTLEFLLMVDFLRIFKITHFVKLLKAF